MEAYKGSRLFHSSLKAGIIALLVLAALFPALFAPLNSAPLHKLGWADGGTTGSGCYTDADIAPNSFNTDYFGNVDLYVDWRAFSTSGSDATVRFRWLCDDVIVAQPADYECTGDCDVTNTETSSFYVAAGTTTVSMQLTIEVNDGGGWSCAYTSQEEDVDLVRPECMYTMSVNGIGTKTLKDVSITVSGSVTDTNCGVAITDNQTNTVEVQLICPVSKTVKKFMTLINGSYSTNVNFPSMVEVGTYYVNVTYTPANPPHPLGPPSASASTSFHRYAHDVSFDQKTIHMFQDNFSIGDIDGPVRADMARDISPPHAMGITPGDSVVIGVEAMEAAQLDTTPDGRAAVFMNVRATYIGDGFEPGLYGPSLEGTYGSYYGDDGEWTVIQADSARVGTEPPDSSTFMFDLNDSLFTRGYLIEYYFEAFDIEGTRALFPSGCDSTEEFLEWTCLPTMTSDILFVDGCNEVYGSEQLYMDAVFEAVIPDYNMPDRFDVNGTNDRCSNGLSSRAQLEHLQAAYSTIIWNCGNYYGATISDRSPETEKDSDCELLKMWLETSENDVGLFVMGADVASDIFGSNDGDSLLGACGIGLVDSSYYHMTGGTGGDGVIYPLLTPVLGGILLSDPFHIEPSSHSTNWFDVMDVDSSIAEGVLEYPEWESEIFYAGIRSTALNDFGYEKKTMWLGFSLSQVRETEPYGMPVRNQIFNDVMDWMGQDVNLIITGDDETPPHTSLSQCYPNPFNPATTIEFSVRERGRIDLTIYDVRGQRIKRLVDGIREAGLHRVQWDGKNDAGVSVASGIYFYKLETEDFRSMKKMVLIR